MERKVNGVGKNTLTISLPSRWVQKNQIKKGDSLTLELLGNNLEVKNPNRTINKPELRFDLKSSNKDYIKAIIRNMYSNGHDKVLLTLKKEEDLLIISEFLSRFEGFEMTESRSKVCTLESYYEVNPEQFALFYNKLFQIVVAIQEEIARMIEKNYSRDTSSIVNNLYENNSRYNCICRRTLIKRNELHSDENILRFYSINFIHMITRTYYELYKYCLENKPQLEKHYLDFFDKITEAFSQLFKLHQKRLTDEMDILERRKDLLSNKLPKLFRKSPGDEGMFLHYNAEVIRLIGTIAPKISLLNQCEKIRIMQQQERDFLK